MSIEQFMNFEWWTVLSSFIYIGTAYLLTLPIGWDREQRQKSAGVRTFPLIAVATCAFTILGEGLGDASAHGRVVGAVVSGLGFLGGGVILKKEDKVDGMSTAVSIWVTGAIGLSTGLGRIEIAIMLALVCFLSLRYGKVVKPS